LVLVDSVNVLNQTLLLKVEELVSLFNLISLETQASNLHVLCEGKLFEAKVLLSGLEEIFLVLLCLVLSFDALFVGIGKLVVQISDDILKFLNHLLKR